MTPWLRWMPLLATLASLGGSPARLPAQSPPDTVEAILQLHNTLARHAARLAVIWPSFRPDTLSVLYVIPGIAKLLTPWPDPPPAGMTALAPGGGAWSGRGSVSFPRGRPIGFLSVDSTASPALVLGTAVHEAFHSFELTRQGPDRRFGAGENSMLVMSYPVFDAENLALLARESTLLHRAATAKSAAEAKREAREFLAVRRARQARLTPEMVEFERRAELHEGLAQYTLVRSLALLAMLEPTLAEGARREIRNEQTQLDSVLTVGPRSIRRHYYASGAAIGLLLDRLSDPGWKERIEAGDEWLEDELVRVVGPVPAAIAPLPTSLRLAAALAVDSLRAHRQTQLDSLLGRSGIRLTLTQPRPGMLQPCGFDPQNTLQVTPGRLLHTRFLRLCADSGTSAEFDRPVLEDQPAASFVTGLDVDDSLVIAVSGEAIPSPAGAREVTNLTVHGPGVELRAAHAVLVGGPGRLMVIPY